VFVSREENRVQILLGKWNKKKKERSIRSNNWVFASPTQTQLWYTKIFKKNIIVSCWKLSKINESLEMWISAGCLKCLMAVLCSVAWCLAHQQQREDGAYVAEDVSIPYGTSSCFTLFIIVIIIIIIIIL